MNHYFKIRSQSKYQNSSNEIASLTLEIFQDNQWQELILDNQSGGFLLFINGLFSCQHLYMRTNCAERDLVLFSSKGTLEVTANKVWQIKKLSVHFDIYIETGTPSDEDTAYIIERMHHCPVSANFLYKKKVKNSLCFI